MMEKQRKKNKIMSVKRTKFLEFWKPRLKSLSEDIATKFKLTYIRAS